MKHVGIDIKFYNLDTFNKQIDVNFIDLDSELVDLNYKVASLIFCHVWRSIGNKNAVFFSPKFKSTANFSAPAQEGNLFFLSGISAQKKIDNFPHQIEPFMPDFEACLAFVQCL